VLQQGEVQPGETVVILGAGKVGLSVLDVLCHGTGVCLAICTDVHPFRLELARRVGAAHTIDVTRDDPVERVLEITNGSGADCVIEAVGHYHEMAGQEAPLGQAVRMIRHGGRIVTVGLGEQSSAVHFKTLVLKEARIIASRVTRGEFPRAVHLLSQGLLHPGLLITDQRPIQEIAAAFGKVDRDDPTTLKVVLEVRGADGR
jgi:threonine dehydrogenase-like Zn-dependent dehydrogenase